jgi:hypothetical protein
MRQIKKLFVCVLVVASLLTLAAGGYVMYSIDEAFFSSPVYQPISGAVSIGSDWMEISPPAPLKSVDMQQHVHLKMQGVELAENDYKTVKYRDGRLGKIEALLFDDKGYSYELQIVGIGVGIYLSRKRSPRPLDAPPTHEPDFPHDRVYTKLRIRSDIPIHSDEIRWVCTHQK